MSLFAITWPIFIEILLHMVMGNADTLMLSQYSDNAVAAVGISNQIISVVIVMFGFITAGTGILVAQQLGAGNLEKAGKASVVSLVTNLSFGLLLSTFLLLGGGYVLKMMNVPEEIMEDARLYIQIVGAFIFIQALLMTLGAILRSHGYTKDSMYVTIGMNIINIVGNFILIFGVFGLPALGVTGVAISTVASRLLGFVVLFAVVYKRTKDHLCFHQIWKGPKKELKQLLSIGIPSAGEHLSYNTSQMAITYFVVQMGTEALTTRVYTQNITMFVFLFSVAVGQGNQILIGHFTGGGEWERANKRCIRSIWLAAGISTFIAVIVYLNSSIIFSLFTDNSEIIATGSVLLLINIFLEPGRAFNLVVINSLRAAGDVRFPVYIGILSMWGIAVMLSYAFGLEAGLALAGIWIAMTADEWLRGLLMIWRWNKGHWRSMSFTQKKSEQA